MLSVLICALDRVVLFLLKDGRRLILYRICFPALLRLTASGRLSAPRYPLSPRTVFSLPVNMCLITEVPDVPFLPSPNARDPLSPRNDAVYRLQKIFLLRPHRFQPVIQWNSKPITHVASCYRWTESIFCVGECDDVDTHRHVFEMIFEMPDQSHHYKMITGKKINP